MARKGLLVRLDAKPAKDGEVEKFLLSALPLVQQENAATAWFAICFGRSEYAIFDVFPDEESRDAHLNGPVAKALMEQADTLFSGQPLIQRLDVLADKLPHDTKEVATKALLLTFKAKSGHTLLVEDFLRDARAMALHEPKTITWFAIRFNDGNYGIFDVFPDNAGRFAHLTGHVPRELAKHAFSLLGGVPDIHMIEVQAHHFAV